MGGDRVEHVDPVALTLGREIAARARTEVDDRAPAAGGFRERRDPGVTGATQPAR